MGKYSLIRLINYPPLPVDLEAGRERCVEHVDYGTFTFLFQDSSGGLQVRLFAFVIGWSDMFLCSYTCSLIILLCVW